MLKRTIRFIRIVIDMIRESSMPGLRSSGSFRVRYPDGQKTYWMTYAEAKEMRSIFKGTIEWKGDFV